MRSFFISLTILAALIGVIIWNSVWTTKRLDDLISLCGKIENGSPALEELTANWQDCRKIISLSINHSEIDRVESALCGLESFSAGSDEFISYLKELENALTHISDAQKLKLDNIL